MYNFLKDKSVLYIEDELDVLKNISTLLSNFFGDFHTASDGVRALEIFNKEPIDLLLVDIELPKMNGIELIKHIRKTDKDVPIIVISAYTKTDYLLESVELGLNKYIVKPLTSKKIHELLEKTNRYFSQDGIISLSNEVSLNKSTSVVSHGGEEYALSAKELDFLDLLAHKRMVSYDEIATLWEDTIPTENAIRSYIKHLRKKLPAGLLKNRNG
ncbi:MAG TPA: response regulator transcription factor, partial [Sulfurovum sp.]|nr:response regulator transcription factor [Sulfurovum sp.]